MTLKSIEEIRNHLNEGDFLLTIHATTRIVERNISSKEITEAGSNAEIIENYPDDKYEPSCLLLGLTKQNRPLHIQVSRGGGKKMKIITIYQPDLKKWKSNFKERTIHGNKYL